MQENPPSPESPRGGRGWRRRYGRSGTLLLAALVLLFIGCAYHVIDGPSPWDREVSKRVEAGKDLRAREYGIIGVWWGCLIGAGISAGLIASAGLWMPGGRQRNRFQGTPHPVVGGWFLGAAALILLSGTLIRAPQLHHSLWNDEEYAMRRYAHGAYEVNPQGRLEFEPVEWEATLFLCANGNNHHLHSLLSRLSLDLWRSGSGAERSDFSEPALRAPSFIAGVFTLICIALLGLEVGGPRVGLGAMALLALHPWHVRYAVEAKGYSLMLLFICIAILALLHALRRDKLLPWLLFALAQAGFLLSFAGSLYIAVALNLIALGELLRRRESARIPTLIAFNLIGAVPVLIWMLPSVPQIIAFLHREEILSTPIGLDWARDIGSHLAAGILFINPEPELHSGTSWQLQSETLLWWRALLGYALPALALLGVVAAFNRPPAGRLAVLAILAGGALAILQSVLTGESMLSWYLLFLILPLCIAIPLACQRLARSDWRFSSLLILTLVIAYASATREPRNRFVQHDRQPIREAVASYRETHPEARSGVFGVSDRQILSYDPAATILTSEAQLDGLLEAGRKANEPVFIVFCGRTESGHRRPGLMQRVTKGGQFNRVAEFPGLEAMFSYEVWRWAPLPSS